MPYTVNISSWSELQISSIAVSWPVQLGATTDQKKFKPWGELEFSRAENREKRIRRVMNSLGILLGCSPTGKRSNKHNGQRHMQVIRDKVGDWWYLWCWARGSLIRPASWERSWGVSGCKGHGGGCGWVRLWAFLSLRVTWFDEDKPDEDSGERF